MCPPRPLRHSFVLFTLFCCFFWCPPAWSSDSQTAPFANDTDLFLATGEGGFLSTWLKLGPFTPPEYIEKKTGAIESWDPFSNLSVTDVVFKKRIAHHPFELLAADTNRIGLKPHTPSVVYLAAIVNSPTPQKIYLSVASTSGIQIRLNNGIIHTNSVHSKWVRKDVSLVPLFLTQGQNLLVVKLFKEKPGRWSTYLRLMDTEFRRAANIKIQLPGAARQLSEVFRASGKLEFNRVVNLEDDQVFVDAWLQFEGAKPLIPSTEANLTTDVKDAVSVPLLLNFLHPQKAKYFLSRFSSLDALPNRVKLSMNGDVTYSANIRIRSNHATRLLAMRRTLNKISHAAFPQSTVESMEWRLAHLAALLRAGDGGAEYISRELKNTDKMLAMMVNGEDPYANKRNQLQRRGYRSTVDGSLQPYALYVPPGWKESGDNTFPLVVALHGLNGHPVKTIATLFGNPMGEEETREERIRFPGPIGRARMFVVAPMAFGSSGYYTAGERDVLDVIEEVKKRYRIDESRIYITGASMGGTGAAKIALHYPDRFAAAVPLCGYHNLKYYSQVKNRPLTANEKYLIEVNSNIHWVKNGARLPMYIVHGTQDFPRQSKDLQEHYQLQGYDAQLTLLDAGHNVWDDTYQNGRIFSHFAKYHRKAHPRNVSFKTANLRYNQNHWIRIDKQKHSNAWTTVDGNWDKDGTVTIKTKNVEALTIKKDPVLLESGSLSITVDNQVVSVQEPSGNEVHLYLKNNQWGPHPPKANPLTKRATLAGPMDDIYNEPLLFVYGTGSPYEGTLARRIIGHLKKPRWGMTVKWPVKADVEVSEADLQHYSIVIVGTLAGNRLLQRIHSKLPIQMKNGAITAGEKQFKGSFVAASFIYPNPLNPARYVVVHTGVTNEALFYTAHLPTLLPDYIIYDASEWKTAGGTVLGENRSALLEGFFSEQWQL